MEQKIKQIVLCLYAVGALKIASMIYFFILRVQAMQSLAQYNMTYSTPNFFGFDIVLDVLILVGLFHTVRGLKAQKAMAWACAIALCIVTASSFALPASVYGLILLFNEDLRSHYVKELQEKINL